MMSNMVLGELVLTAGFAIWLLVNVINHLWDTRGTVFAVAAFMKMSSLDQEPVIPTPIKSRRIESAVIHRLATALISLAQAVFGVALAFAAWQLLRGSVAEGEHLAACAFAGLTSLWFVFLIADAWFGAWIRQGDLQRTHLLLLGITLFAWLIFAH